MKPISYKNNQASSDKTILSIIGEVTTKLNPQLNTPLYGSNLASKSGIDLDGSLERYGHPRIFYLDSVMRNLPNLFHS